MKFSKEVERILSWMVKYSDEFKGNREKAINHLMELGKDAYLKKGFEEMTPLDDEVSDALAKSGNESLKKYLSSIDSE